MQKQVSYDKILKILRSSEGDNFFKSLMGENSEKVKEQLSMLNIMARMSCMNYLKDGTMSVDQVNNFCLEAKALYILEYYNHENIELAIKIPLWLLNKYFI